MKKNIGLSKTKVKDPDIIELVLVGVLLIWTVSSFMLLNKAATLATPNLISWTSLTTFFTGFASIVLIVIAIIVADVRKEVSK